LLLDALHQIESCNQVPDVSADNSTSP
jgi:hypothetical protein